MYSKMASEVYGVPYDECKEFWPDGSVNKEGKNRRKSVKSLLLGILYGRGTKSIATQLGTSENEAQQLIDNFFKAFPKIKELDRLTKLGASQNGYVTTIFGSKRRLPDIKSKDRYVKARAERQCLNAVIQGSSALVLKIAMINIYNNSRIKETNSKILLTVHDELILECPTEYAKEVAEIMTSIMKDTGEKLVGIKMKCDEEFMFRWGEPIDIQEVL